jgi:hypothetical protein
VTEGSIRSLSEESRVLRLKLYELCRQGKTEDQALFEILPDDHDRYFRFLEWQEMGLWPPPEVEDLTESVTAAAPRPPAPAGSGPLDLSNYDIPQAWIERITGLVNAIVNAAVLDYHSMQKDQVEALVASALDEKIAGIGAQLRTMPADGARIPGPPTVPDAKPAKRARAKRAKLHGSCDHALFEQFEADRNARGFSVSEMLDFILFNYYGKPPLSFKKE